MMATTYAGVGNPRDFDQVDYGNGIVGTKTANGWMYPWRKDPYQDVLNDNDVISQQQLQTFRDSNTSAHVAGDDQTAWAQMIGQAPLNANDAQGNNSGTPIAPSAQATQNQTPAQQWNAQPDPVPAQPAAAPLQQQQSTLFDELQRRFQQSETPSANDPVIRRQADTYSANTERSKRNYLADLAESSGPNANLLGETRLANEHAGQANAGFEAELVGREVAARRDEIQQALTQFGSLLTAEQQMALQKELAQLNDQLQRTSLSQQGQQFNANLSQQNAQFGKTQAQQLDEFLRELALREANQNQQWDYNWATL